MEKKCVWVVTNVVIGRVTLYVNTYSLRWFDDLDEAKRFLEDEYRSLCEQGYEPSRFTFRCMGWTYKDDYIILHREISLALGV